MRWPPSALEVSCALLLPEAVDLRRGVGMTRASTVVAHLPAASDTVIEAERIGSCAIRHSTAGTVHSVYRRACNIATDTGGLVTLLAQDVGNLPHGISCVLPVPENFQRLFAPGQEVIMGQAELQIPAARIIVDLSGASEWRCPLPSVSVQSEATQRTLTGLRRILQNHPSTGGFAPLLVGTEPPSSAFDLALQRRLARALPALQEAANQSDPAAAVQALAQLIGLGPGLTPSGDDFIVGYLAALHSSRACEAGVGLLLTALAAPVERLAAGTNLISRQFIRNALEGAFSEALGDLLSAIAHQDEARVLTFASQVLAMGHSSGADALAGLLFGLCPVLLVGRAVPTRTTPVAALG